MTERTLPPSSDAAMVTRMRAARAALEQADHHPDFEMLAALVDDTLPPDEAGVLHRHVDECPVCAEDVEDLRQTRAALSQWTGPSAIATAGRSSQAHPAFWAAAAVIAGIAAGLAWWVTRTTTPAPQPIAQQASQPATQPPVVQSPPVIVQDGALHLSIASDGTVAGLDRLAVGDAAMVTDLLKTRHLPSAKIVSELRPANGALMGAAADQARFTVTSPAGTVVSSDRPAFRWTALAGATSYTVSVFDTRLNPVAESGAITSVQWTPPAPLARGVVLVWQVEAATPHGTVLAPQAGVPEARFSVISEADQLALKDGQDRAGGSHLALAALYSSFGLIDDAGNELDALAKDNPGSSFVAELTAQLKRRP